jgi:hypothetical protein
VGLKTSPGAGPLVELVLLAESQGPGSWKGISQIYCPFRNYKIDPRYQGMVV